MKLTKMAPYILILIVVIVYFPTLSYDFVSDDIAIIVKNPELYDLSSVFAQPLLSLRPLLYFIAFKLGGLNPAPFRLINIFFHTGSVVTLYYLLPTFKQLSSQRTAFFIAVLFAVHPIITESVTWISGGSTAQYGFLTLFVLFLHRTSQKKPLFFLGSFSVFLLLIGSAPAAIVCGLILALYTFVFENRPTGYKKIIPYWMLIGIATAFYFNQFSARVEGLGVLTGLSPGSDNMFIKIPVALTTYIGLLVWPHNLTLYHYDFSMSVLEFVGRLSVLLLLIISWLVAFRKDRFVFFWTGVFLISTVPTLTHLKITWVVAERYAYLGSAALITVGVHLLDRYFSTIKHQKALFFLIIGISMILFIRTNIRNRDWKNEDTLWLATAKTSPSSPQNHNNLGDYYSRNNNYEMALGEFISATKLNPRYADAYHNAGLTLVKLKRYEEAISYFEKALTYKESLWQSHQQLSAIYFSQKKYTGSKSHIIQALIIDPQNKQLKENLNSIEQAIKKFSITD